ncbi:MAG: STAS-like domain-containing protein [Candidatus Auribacterota bacterium]
MSLKNFILKNIENHQNDIIDFTVDHCKVSRQAVYKQLRVLIGDGLIYKKRRGQYFLSSDNKKSYEFRITEELQEDLVWKNFLKVFFEGFSENVYSICYYGFTEMLNNVIDHSGGKTVQVSSWIDNNSIEIMIIDDGIGIFNKIMNAFKLDDIRESLFQLTKGKLTTDPEHHTGEGIFFTSRAFDKFSIWSGELFYYKNVVADDWYLETRQNKKAGTLVLMEIDINSKRNLNEVFSKFTSGENFAFNKTHIVVDLAKHEDEEYISRSQAKRLLANLDKFEHVILDFKKVSTVGQGFVDEVFRVYKNRNPHVTIEYKNTNADVEFMIKRSVPQ